MLSGSSLPLRALRPCGRGRLLLQDEADGVMADAEAAAGLCCCQAFVPDEPVQHARVDVPQVAAG
jgi:hypothetical protein